MFSSLHQSAPSAPEKSAGATQKRSEPAQCMQAGLGKQSPAKQTKTAPKKPRQLDASSKRKRPAAPAHRQRNGTASSQTDKRINVLETPIDVRAQRRKEELKAPSARAIQRMQQTETSDISRRLSALRTWVLVSQIIQRSTVDSVTADSAIALSRASQPPEHNGTD